MSSEESLSTRLRPGVTTKLVKSRATNNLQDDLMRLIDPDIADSDIAGILVSDYFSQLSLEYTCNKSVN